MNWTKSKENTTKIIKAKIELKYFLELLFFLKQGISKAYIFDVMAMIAIGKRRAKEYLLVNLQKSKGQNGRKPMRKIVMEKRFAEKQTSMH
jgi:hypothetical protein